MGECSSCKHYDWEYWELTYDWINLCTHDPEPDNRDDIFDGDANCPYFEEERTKE